MFESEKIKQELAERRDREIDTLIDRFDMENKCSLTRQEIHKIVRRGMILNNLAYILADVVNTLLMDMEDEIGKFGVALSRQDKHNFKQMMMYIRGAKEWSEKCALPIYEIKDADNACYDSDWWHNLILLIDSRTGDDARKSNLLLEFLLNMPEEEDLFHITYNDFKRPVKQP